MFEYIKGRVEVQGADHIVVDCQGLGYYIQVSAHTLTEFALGETAKVYLHTSFKDDGVSLYGFATQEEREVFRTVIGVSGVGPKAAMGLLSKFRQDELIRYILNDDVKAITQAPGIGQKTAGRIVLELKDKYKHYTLATPTVQPTTEAEQIEVDNTYNDAIGGLLGLGYSYSEAAALVDKIMRPGMSIEEILKQALIAANVG